MVHKLATLENARWENCLGVFLYREWCFGSGRSDETPVLLNDDSGNRVKLENLARYAGPLTAP